MEASVELFTIGEAALLLRVPEGWLRKKVSARSVPHTRLGKHVRFTRDHLQQIVVYGEARLASPTPPSHYGLSTRVRRACPGPPPGDLSASAGSRLHSGPSVAEQ